MRTPDPSRTVIANLQPNMPRHKIVPPTAQTMVQITILTCVPNSFQIRPCEEQGAVAAVDTEFNELSNRMPRNHMTDLFQLSGGW